MLYNNDNEFNIIKTYQMYRKDSLEHLSQDLKLFQSKNKLFGSKLVRGAYWNSEKKLGTLYIDKYKTDINYDQGIIFISENNINTYNILATHNKSSINLGINLNKFKKKKIFDFAHLAGMCEHIYNSKNILSNESIHVYLPYGPYTKMLPYLLRRLYENIDSIKYMIR